MIKYIAPENCRVLIKINTEDTDNIKIVESTNTNIDWMWIADEDGEFEGKPVKKGNVIIKFYDNYDSLENQFIVIDNEELTNIYTTIAAKRQQYLDSVAKKCECAESPCKC